MHKYIIGEHKYEGEEYKNIIDQLSFTDILDITNEDGWVLTIGNNCEFNSMLIWINNEDLYTFKKKADKEIVINIASLFINRQLDLDNKNDWSADRARDWDVFKIFLTVTFSLLIIFFLFKLLKAWLS